MTSVIVIDLETTGLGGIEEGDRIVAVAAVTVDLEKATVTPTFYSPVRLNLTPEEQNAWIFREGHMTTEEVTRSLIDEIDAVGILATILDGHYVTSYNTDFDLDRFIYPWFDQIIPDECRISFIRAPCLMKASAQVPEIPRVIRDDPTCYPTLMASYLILTDSNPMRAHNALNDCIMAGKVLLNLYDRGLYDPDREEEY